MKILLPRLRKIFFFEILMQRGNQYFEIDLTPTVILTFFKGGELWAPRTPDDDEHDYERTFDRFQRIAPCVGKSTSAIYTQTPDQPPPAAS